MQPNKEWQKQALDLHNQIISLLEEYELRKSKQIRFVPTDKEIREAVHLYKILLDDVDTGNESSLKFKKILDEVSTNVEEQIKLFGFLFETLEKYPNGAVPHDILMEEAEKWNVLDYMIEDMMRIYFNKSTVLLDENGV